MKEDLRSKLAAELLPATWAALEPHFRRDALFVIAAGVSLLDAAVAIAEDDKARVAAWIESGRVRRPSVEEAAELAKSEGASFLSVVVQPFVFVQRLEDFVEEGGAKE
ncbi:MAG: DUF2288 family protein [Sandaracinus sp.]|nr:DUF2288 family protein [Sandaracinus sp.]